MVRPTTHSVIESEMPRHTASTSKDRANSGASGSCAYAHGLLADATIPTTLSWT